ncbi:MAG TPA: toxin-antitoxin system HicB family antitoxin [Polyangiaceae bacterium]|nr:toxin-antitoxin system HicB family antitoxin [Polyangiaceae bacterium]
MRSGIKKTKSRKRSPTSGRPTPEDYQMVIEWSETDHCYVTTLPAWQNAQTHAATIGKAAQRGHEVLQLLIDSALEAGEKIPEPQRRYSGNLRLRLPTSLHGRLAREAEREGVSLNQWIVGKLTG